MALDQLAEVADQRYLRLVALLIDLVGVRLVGGVDPGHDRFRPTVERRFVLARHAEQRADDLDRQRVREVVDDVDLLPIAEPGDEVVDERRDLRLAFGHSRRVVGRAQLAHRDPAPAVVLGRVPSDERGKTGWCKPSGGFARRRGSELMRGSWSSALISRYVLTTYVPSSW